MLKQHPLSAAFPEMSADDFQALKDSIEHIGVRNPITLFEGMVIDGWHRYNAANELDMDCPSVDLGDVDPRDFVLAQNKARRHVTQAQLAMATAAVYEWRPNGGNHSALSAECVKSTKELAEVAGVGVRSIEQAKTVQTKAAPEVVEAVKRGEIGLPKAAAIAQLPKEEQAAAISKRVSEIKPPKEEVVAIGDDEELPDYSELDQAHDQILHLQDALFSAMSVSTSQEDRERADQKFAELRNENKSLLAQLTVAEQARDALLNENAAMKRTIAALRREIEKLKQGVAA